MYDKYLCALKLRFFSFGMAVNDNDCVDVVPLIEYKVTKTSQAETNRKLELSLRLYGTFH